MSCGRKSCGSERAAGSGQGADSGCRIAQVDGWIGEKFLLRVLNYPGIAFLAAELFDIPHVHGFTFQQEGLSDGSAQNEFDAYPPGKLIPNISLLHAAPLPHLQARSACG